MPFYFSFTDPKKIKEAKRWLQRRKYEFTEVDGNFKVLGVSPIASNEIRTSLAIGVVEEEPIKEEPSKSFERVGDKIVSSLKRVEGKVDKVLQRSEKTKELTEEH